MILHGYAQKTESVAKAFFIFFRLSVFLKSRVWFHVFFAVFKRRQFAPKSLSYFVGRLLSVRRLFFVYLVTFPKGLLCFESVSI